MPFRDTLNKVKATLSSNSSKKTDEFKAVEYNDIKAEPLEEEPIPKYKQPRKFFEGPDIVYDSDDERIMDVYENASRKKVTSDDSSRY